MNVKTKKHRIKMALFVAYICMGSVLYAEPPEEELGHISEPTEVPMPPEGETEPIPETEPETSEMPPSPEPPVPPETTGENDCQTSIPDINDRIVQLIYPQLNISAIQPLATTPKNNGEPAEELPNPQVYVDFVSDAPVSVGPRGGTNTIDMSGECVGKAFVDYNPTQKHEKEVSYIVFNLSLADPSGQSDQIIVSHDNNEMVNKSTCYDLSQIPEDPALPEEIEEPNPPTETLTYNEFDFTFFTPVGLVMECGS